MLHNSSVAKFSFIFSFALLLIFAAGCAEVRLNTIPAPPPTAKLRVFMQVLTSPPDPGWSWKMPHQVFEQNVLRGTAEMLQRTGIYEVVTQEDVKAVLGGGALSRVDWARKNWALAKQAGQALHAQYMVLVERSAVRGIIYWEMVLINTETEKKFRVLGRMGLRPYYDMKDYENIFRIFGQELFDIAKNDALATAIRKGRLAAPQFFTVRSSMPEESTAPIPAKVPPTPPILPPPSAKTAPAPLRPSSTVAKSAAVEKPPATAKPEPSQAPPAPSPAAPKPAPVEKPLVAKAERVKEAPPVVKPAPVPAVPKTTETIPVRPAVPPLPRLEEKPSAPQEITREVKIEEVLSAEAIAKGGTNLAVYDLDTIEPYRVIALILSEALRQELFKLGLFQMVNRENIVKVLEELALQQTGLVDEKEAARAGKGLAAQQIVLGRYGILGKNSVVQAKRVDVETQGTLGLGTLRCDLGREDELLEHMTELAREIAKKK